MQQLIPTILAALAALATAAAADQPAAPAPPQAPARWGAANAANLKAMARAGDLAAPAAATLGSGQLEAAAVQRLMEGKVIDLVREGSQGSQGGQGGQGGGSPQ